MEQTNKKRYISCDLIENGFDFNTEAINFCCRPGAGKGGFTAIIPEYKGETINWEEFFAVKNKYRNILRENKMVPECKDCIYLYENDWDTDNYISNLNFNNGITCNARCIYCYLDNFRKGNPNFRAYKVLPIIKDMIDKKILKNNGAITIAGGEPTIDPEFEELISIFIEEGMTSIRVLSNGIKHSKMIEKALNKGIMYIVISMDSGTKKTFEAIKRVPGYDSAWNNVKKYVKMQIKPDQVRTKYIIIPGVNHQKTEIDAWIKKNIECGVKSVSIDVELCWFDQHKDNIPQAIYGLLNYVIEQAQKNNMSVEPGDRAVILLKEQNNNHGLIFQGREL